MCSIAGSIINTKLKFQNFLNLRKIEDQTINHLKNLNSIKDLYFFPLDKIVDRNDDQPTYDLW